MLAREAACLLPAPSVKSRAPRAYDHLDDVRG